MFLLDMVLFMIPLVINVIFLFGTEKAREAIAANSLIWLVDVFLGVISLLTLLFLGYTGWGLSAITFTEFTGLL